MNYVVAELYFSKLFKEEHKNLIQALVGVAQWTECWPVSQGVAGLIPSQGICPDWESNRSPVGSAWEATTY